MEKVALSIAGGGVRALLGIGVYRALRDKGINIDIFAGMSAGSIVASLLALEIGDQEVDQILAELSKRNFMNFNPFRFEILSSYKFRKSLGYIFENKKFEDLHKKLVLIATDLDKQDSVFIEEGSLLDGIIASSSQPPYFRSPVIKGVRFSDGGFSSFYGVRHLRNIGADKIIGVDPGAFTPVKIFAPLNDFSDSVLVLYKKIVEYENRIFPVDIEINDFKTDVRAIDTRLIHKELIDIGYSATVSKMGEILSAI